MFKITFSSAVSGGVRGGERGKIGRLATVGERSAPSVELGGDGVRSGQMRYRIGSSTSSPSGSYVGASLPGGLGGKVETYIQRTRPSLKRLQLTYEIPVNRLPNSKNRPENINAARCSSGSALPIGVSRKPPSLRLNLPHALSSSAARRCATADGDVSTEGISKKSTVARRRCDQ